MCQFPTFVYQVSVWTQRLVPQASWCYIHPLAEKGISYDQARCQQIYYAKAGKTSQAAAANGGWERPTASTLDSILADFEFVK